MRFLTIQLICVDSRILHYFTIRVAVESCPVLHHLLFYTGLSDLYISLITKRLSISGSEAYITVHRHG